MLLVYDLFAILLSIIDFVSCYWFCELFDYSIASPCFYFCLVPTSLHACWYTFYSESAVYCSVSATACDRCIVATVDHTVVPCELNVCSVSTNSHFAFVDLNVITRFLFAVPSMCNLQLLHLKNFPAICLQVCSASEFLRCCLHSCSHMYFCAFFHILAKRVGFIKCAV